MRNTLKKIVALLGAVVLLATSVTVHAEETTEAGVPMTIEDEVKEDILVTFIPAQEDLYNGLDPESIVLTVGEDKIPLKKAYFLVKFQQAIMQEMLLLTYGSGWYSLPLEDGGSIQEEAKESIMNLLIRMSLAKQNQKELGVSLSKSDKENIKEAVDLFMASNSDEALAAMMADEALVTEILEDYTILSKVITAVTKDVQVEYGEAKTYSYVYGSFGEDAGTTDLNDVSSETESMMEAFNNIYRAASSGTDFDTAAAEQGYPTALHTYFVGDERDALAEFNKAMDGKQLGEISNITYVGDNMGMFIGCMQEVDEDSLADAKASYRVSEQLKVLKKEVKEWLSHKEAVIKEDIWSQVTMEKSIGIYKAAVTTE